MKIACIALSIIRCILGMLLNILHEARHSRREKILEDIDRKKREKEENTSQRHRGI